MKLSKAQRVALIKLKVLKKRSEERGDLDYEKIGFSAYDIGASIATMNALRKKGLVIAKHDIGSFSWPRSCIRYRFTEKGLLEV